MARPLGPAEQILEPLLALDQRQVAEVDAVMLDQVEGEQHRFMAPALASQRVEVGRAIVAGDYCFTVYQERRCQDVGSATATRAWKRSPQS
jgi:hypothetical protein